MPGLPAATAAAYTAPGATVTSAGPAVFSLLLLAGEEHVCPACVGSGLVAQGIGLRTCGRCRGDGVYRRRPRQQRRR